jgi:hypothetical protein
MIVTLCSAFRNNAHRVTPYFQQVEGLAKLLEPQGIRITLVLGYGDSHDTTGEVLYERAGFSTLGTLLVNCTHGGKAFGSIVNADRFRQLAYVAGRMWESVPQGADAVGLVDGDLAWEPETLAALVGHLQKVPAIAPMVMHQSDPGLYAGVGPFFYDTFAFKRYGVNFTNEPPYHADLAKCDGLVSMDSAGGCLLVRGKLAEGLQWRRENLVVGICEQIQARGGSIWLDPRLQVYHP